jgi:hypothetical protein
MHDVAAGGAIPARARKRRGRAGSRSIGRAGTRCSCSERASAPMRSAPPPPRPSCDAVGEHGARAARAWLERRLERIDEGGRRRGPPCDSRPGSGCPRGAYGTSSSDGAGTSPSPVPVAARTPWRPYQRGEDARRRRTWSGLVRTPRIASGASSSRIPLVRTLARGAVRRRSERVRAGRLTRHLGVAPGETRANLGHGASQSSARAVPLRDAARAAQSHSPGAIRSAKSRPSPRRTYNFIFLHRSRYQYAPPRQRPRGTGVPPGTHGLLRARSSRTEARRCRARSGERQAVELGAGGARPTAASTPSSSSFAAAVGGRHHDSWVPAGRRKNEPAMVAATRRVEGGRQAALPR